MASRCLLFFCFVSMLLAGCFGPPQPDYSGLGIVDISGKITLDGKPLSKAAIFFHDRENRRYSWGVTDDSGRYKLMFDSRKSGVLPGVKEIEITTSKDPSASPAGDVNDESSVGFDIEGSEPDAKPEKQEMVPAKYNRNSTLTYEVTKSASDVDFDLVSD